MMKRTTAFIFNYFFSRSIEASALCKKVKPVQPRAEEPVCSHHQLTSCSVYPCAAYLTPLTPIYISYIIVMYECIMQSPAPLDFFILLIFFSTIELIFAHTDRQMRAHMYRHTHPTKHTVMQTRTHT